MSPGKKACLACQACQACQESHSKHVTAVGVFTVKWCLPRQTAPPTSVTGKPNPAVPKRIKLFVVTGPPAAGKSLLVRTMVAALRNG